MSFAHLLILEGVGWLTSALEEEGRKRREVRDGGRTRGPVTTLCAQEDSLDVVSILPCSETTQDPSPHNITPHPSYLEPTLSLHTVLTGMAVLSTRHDLSSSKPVVLACVQAGMGQAGGGRDTVLAEAETRGLQLWGQGGPSLLNIPYDVTKLMGRRDNVIPKERYILFSVLYWKKQGRVK